VGVGEMTTGKSSRAAIPLEFFAYHDCEFRAIMNAKIGPS